MKRMNGRLKSNRYHLKGCSSQNELVIKCVSCLNIILYAFIQLLKIVDFVAKWAIIMTIPIAIYMATGGNTLDFMTVEIYEIKVLHLWSEFLLKLDALKTSLLNTSFIIASEISGITSN